jgi:hypothetical protein
MKRRSATNDIIREHQAIKTSDGRQRWMVRVSTTVIISGSFSLTLVPQISTEKVARFS